MAPIIYGGYMSFKKGDILEYEFRSKDGSKVIDGVHRAIVLHTRITPYNTILIAPITTAEGLVDANRVPLNFLKLDAEKYPFVLQHDSYVNLDMIATVDGDELKVLERYGKRIVAALNNEDGKELDYKLALTYELQEFVKKETETEVKKEIENVVEYIDTDIRKKVYKIMDMLNDEDVRKFLENLIDVDLIKTLKESYNLK